MQLLAQRALDHVADGALGVGHQRVQGHLVDLFARQLGAQLHEADLGAIAAGKTDCLAAIRKAISQVAAAGGGTVIFPPAKQPYVVSGTVIIRSSNVKLSGKGATIKLADGAANGTKAKRTTDSQVHVLWVAGEPNKPVQRIEIRGLTIDATIYRQEDYYNPRAIVSEHGTRAGVRNVKILRPFVGVDIGAAFMDTIHVFKRSVFVFAGLSALLTIVVALGLARSITRTSGQ